MQHALSRYRWTSRSKLVRHCSLANRISSFTLAFPSCRDIFLFCFNLTEPARVPKRDNRAAAKDDMTKAARRKNERTRISGISTAGRVSAELESIVLNARGNNTTALGRSLSSQRVNKTTKRPAGKPRSSFMIPLHRQSALSVPGRVDQRHYPRPRDSSETCTVRDFIVLWFRLGKRFDRCLLNQCARRVEGNNEVPKDYSAVADFSIQEYAFKPPASASVCTQGNYIPRGSRNLRRISNRAHESRKRLVKARAINKNAAKRISPTKYRSGATLASHDEAGNEGARRLINSGV